MQGADCISEDEGSEDVERRLFRQPQQGRQDDLLRLLSYNLDDRRLLDLVIVQKRLEHGRLENAEADPQADTDQNDRQREGNAPAPGRELIAGQLAEGEYREIREKQAARHAELRPRRYQAALAVVTRPFHRQQNGSTPFAADADALNHPQHRQDNRAPDADRFVGRNERDQEGGDAYAQQRCNQRRLAADAVSVVAEDRSADRTPDKADEGGSKGGERRRQRIRIGKEQLS